MDFVNQRISFKFALIRLGNSIKTRVDINKLFELE